MLLQTGATICFPLFFQARELDSNVHYYYSSYPYSMHETTRRNIFLFNLFYFPCRCYIFLFLLFLLLNVDVVFVRERTSVYLLYIKEKKIVKVAAHKRVFVCVWVCVQMVLHELICSVIYVLRASYRNNGWHDKNHRIERRNCYDSVLKH